MTFLLLP